MHMNIKLEMYIYNKSKNHLTRAIMRHFCASE